MVICIVKFVILVTDADLVLVAGAPQDALENTLVINSFLNMACMLR